MNPFGDPRTALRNRVDPRAGVTIIHPDRRGSEVSDRLRQVEASVADLMSSHRVKPDADEAVRRLDKVTVWTWQSADIDLRDFAELVQELVEAAEPAWSVQTTGTSD